MLDYLKRLFTFWPVWVVMVLMLTATLVFDWGLTANLIIWGASGVWVLWCIRFTPFKTIEL